MSSEYAYDKSNEHWPFYVVVLSGLVTLPLTYSLLPSRDASALAHRTTVDYKVKDAKVIEAQLKARSRKNRRILSILIALTGWAVLAYMIYLITMVERKPPKIYNPYDILGISETATEQQIKKHYKRMSLKFHPDKIRPDPAKNQTLETINLKFTEMTQAYQALTDEVVRENVRNYGHPDGKQPWSYGVALPSWLVQDKRVSSFVMALYSLLFLILLPYTVGSWWYGLQRMSKDGVLMESANELFREYSETADVGDVITALSVGKEFEPLVRQIDDTQLTKIEHKLLNDDTIPSKGRLSAKDRKKLEAMDNTTRRKALALLWAYLYRIDLDDASLTALKYEAGPIAHALVNSWTAICLAYGNAGPILSAFRTSQYLIQAVPPEASPLLQLPCFTHEIVQSVKERSASHNWTVSSLMDLPDTTRRKLLIGPGRLNDENYDVVVKVGSDLPQFTVVKAFFKVVGEKNITPHSLVSFIIKGMFRFPGYEDMPPVDEFELEDIDPPEDDIEAVLGRKKVRRVKAADGKVLLKEDTTALPPMVFAPYYARKHMPKWSVFLTDEKQAKMAVQPFTFTSFNAPIMTQDGKPTFAVQTLKAQFQAPPQPGRYTFTLHVVCDSYVGTDTRLEVTLQVEEPSQALSTREEDEISEPDEDSIAGQIGALKSGSVASRRKKVDSSSDESNTDDDDGDEPSDTNTDTDEESEVKKT